jgi:hypothetical protein
MALTKREKYIAMGVGAAVGLFLLDQVVFTPYFDAMSAIADQTDTAVAKQKENTALFDRQTRLKKVWTDITQGGLKADDSAAESQALNAALDWAQAAGVNITAVKPERTTVANEFQVIGFHLTGNGSTPAMARLLYSFETASIPVRVDEMQLTPVKEGTDSLKIELSLSTLCLKPDTDSAAKTTASAAGYTAAEVQPWSE